MWTSQCIVKSTCGLHILLRLCDFVYDSVYDLAFDSDHDSSCTIAARNNQPAIVQEQRGSLERGGLKRGGLAVFERIGLQDLSRRACSSQCIGNLQSALRVWDPNFGLDQEGQRRRDSLLERERETQIETKIETKIETRIENEWQGLIQSEWNGQIMEHTHSWKERVCLCIWHFHQIAKEPPKKFRKRKN